VLNLFSSKIWTPSAQLCIQAGKASAKLPRYQITSDTRSVSLLQDAKIQQLQSLSACCSWGAFSLMGLVESMFYVPLSHESRMPLLPSPLLPAAALLNGQRRRDRRGSAFQQEEAPAPASRCQPSLSWFLIAGLIVSSAASASAGGKKRQPIG
jgi:hypothetical protein